MSSLETLRLQYSRLIAAKPPTQVTLSEWLSHLQCEELDAKLKNNMLILEEFDKVTSNTPHTLY